MSNAEEVGTIPAGGVFLTVRQLAIMLRVSMRTLCQMRRAGRLPAPVRTHGAVKWRLNDVTRWIEGGRTGAAGG